MDRDVRIYTPENVSIRYEAANLGSRLIAIFIDNLIQISVYAILITTLVLTSLDSTEHVEKSEGINIVGLSILIICIFLVNTFYHIFFELVMKGQTPGKKVAKIRVTSVTGEPINFIKSFIRNLVRLVDILPGTYFIGIIVLLFNKRCQRLGDLAANTMVIKVRDSKSFREKVSEILQTDEDNEGEGMISEEKLSGVLIAEENKAEFAVDEKRYRMLKKYLEIRDGFIRKDDYDYLMFRYYNLITGSKVPNNMLPYYRLSFLMDIINQNAPYYD